MPHKTAQTIKYFGSEDVKIGHQRHKKIHDEIILACATDDFLSPALFGQWCAKRPITLYIHK